MLTKAARLKGRFLLIVSATNKEIGGLVMHQQPLTLPNPKRQAAGRRNRLLRGPLTPEGRERLRQTALRNKPWMSSTGPRTEAGKARSAANGRWRQKGERSVRQIRAAVADVWSLIEQMGASRRMLEPNRR